MVRKAGRLGGRHSQHAWWQVEESGGRNILHMGLGCVLLVFFAHGSALAVLGNCPLVLSLISDVADLSPGWESVQVEEANSPSIDGHHHYHQANNVDS